MDTRGAQHLSPVYERLALAVADDDAVVELLEKVEIATLFYLNQRDREAFTTVLSRYGTHRVGCEVSISCPS